MDLLAAPTLLVPHQALALAPAKTVLTQAAMLMIMMMIMMLTMMMMMLTMKIALMKRRPHLHPNTVNPRMEDSDSQMATKTASQSRTTLKLALRPLEATGD